MVWLFKLMFLLLLETNLIKLKKTNNYIITKNKL